MTFVLSFRANKKVYVANMEAEIKRLEELVKNLQVKSRIEDLFQSPTLNL